ncbi:MAG: spore cortex-lytic enzyme [Clostridiales bacterium]|nr:spore cortex-lytic enzyme [Clostridiales bacterium]MBQ3047195.1 spore cortex-lytic enzyme [Clostridia bacterium]
MKKVIKIVAVALMVFSLGFAVTGNIARPNVETAYAAVYQQGNRGTTVKTIQRKLKNWGYYNGAVDGIFGSQTKTAVKYFQRKNGLKVDGIVGNQTLKALGMSTGSNSNSSGATSSYSDADVALLARLIYGEARGESYVGQVAVGAVVMNRIKSASFPNTMSGVIYQSYAFTAVADGQINLTPNETARKAAQDAMNGWDPSYGALYYYNPATATSSWIFSRKTTVTIGNHVFAI